MYNGWWCAHALSQLVNSIVDNNAHDKAIDIIFLYAGGADNELIICNELIACGFTIENKRNVGINDEFIFVI